MKNYITLCIFLFILFPIANAQTWQQKTNIDYRYNATAFSIGSVGYIATGSTTSGVSSDLKEYNPSTNTWTSKTSFPGYSRETSVSFTFQNLGFVGLGWNGSSTFTDFYKYHSTIDTWTPIANFPGIGGRNGVAAAIGSKAYVSGGGYGTSTSISSELWEYDINTDTWTQKASMPFIKRLGSVAFASKTKLYFGLGHNFSVDFTDLWAYSPASNSWAKMADFPGVGRLQASVFEINGKFIVGGGHRYGGGLNSTLNDYYEYDPNTNSWTAIPGFTDDRRTRSEGFAIHGKGYIACGSSVNNTFLNNVWEYTPATAKISVSINESEIGQDIQLSIYPNPAKDFINLTYNGNSTEFRISIINAIGSIVINDEIQVENNTAKIDLQDITEGTYFYVLENQKERHLGQLILIK
jgi:N-acetylneuraminic acid mutarotase